MVALVVTTDNEMFTVEYERPNLEVLHKAVGGFLEHVCPVGLRKPYCMIVNEEGLLLNLSVNLLGSTLYGSFRHGMPIVGNVVFLKEGYYGDEPDLVGMMEDEAQSLGEEFVRLTSGQVRWVLESVEG